MCNLIKQGLRGEVNVVSSCLFSPEYKCSSFSLSESFNVRIASTKRNFHLTLLTQS